MIKSCSHVAACALAVLAFHSSVGFAQHVEGGIDIGDITYGPPPTEEYTPPPVQPQRGGESDGGVGFGINTGLLISPGYTEMMDDAYPLADSSGAAAWLGFGIGLNIHPNSQISIAADAELLLTFVSMSSSTGGTSDFFANVMLIPSVSIRHTVTRPASFFYGLEINNCIPAAGDTDFEWESTGPGIGLVAGIAFGSQAYMEINFRNLPMEVRVADFPAAHEEYDFGGVMFKFRKSF